MKRIGIVAALPGELKPLVRGWKTIERGEMFAGGLPGGEMVAACCGVGREAASRACMLLLNSGEVDALVSVGWAGALTAKVEAGEAYRVKEVVDAATGERYIAEGCATGMKLVTAKRIALHDEKLRLAENYGASLVDMEAATVARLARVRNIPFYCWKAVSDGLAEKLPDINPFLTRDGHLRMSSFVASVLVRPQYWMAMVRMGLNSNRGATALAKAVGSLTSEIH